MQVERQKGRKKDDRKLYVWIRRTVCCLTAEDRARDRVVTEKILSMTEGKPPLDERLQQAYFSRRMRRFAWQRILWESWQSLQGKMWNRWSLRRRSWNGRKLHRRSLGSSRAKQPFCLIEEAVNLETENIDEWIVFRWKRVYPADVFLKFPADGWEKELIETFAGYSHEEIDLERYRKKDRAKF